MSKNPLERLNQEVFPFTDKEGITPKIQYEMDTYGFDTRQVWNVDSSMLALLYQHLVVFYEKADEVIDLDYHHIDTGDDTQPTLREVIEEMISLAHAKLSGQWEEELEEIDTKYEHDFLDTIKESTYDDGSFTLEDSSPSCTELHDVWLEKIKEVDRKEEESIQRFWFLWTCIRPYCWY